MKTFLSATATVVLSVPLLATPSFASAPGQERDLVAHWTFDAGQGDTLQDVSGQGHHGKIHGATWVSSPRGHALRFDGVDDYVDCGKTESLKISRDLTLTAWIKADDVGGRNRMIFGDAAGLSVNRNYSLRIDRNSLRFEYGDGTAYGAILGDPPFPTGSWQFVAVVFEHPHYFIYQNGRIILDGDVSVSVTRTNGDSRRIGGWFAGFFKGDIDDIRLYRRALTHREITKLFGQPATDATPVRVTPHFRYSNKELICEVLCNYPLQAGGQAEVTVLDVSRDRQLMVWRTPLRETRPGSERWRGTTTVSTGDFPGGEHKLIATVRAPGGEPLGPFEVSFTYPGEKPDWLGSSEGISDTVLPPFSPLRTASTDDGCSVLPWGRRYDFGKTPFLSQIISADAPLLARPMRLLVTAEGADVDWSPIRPEILSTSDAVCRFSQRLTGASIDAQFTTTVEYDGLAKIEWYLQCSQATTIERLAVEIPLRSDVARYLYTWPNISSRTFGQAYASKFQPIISLCDEERGLQWVCESERNWSLAQEDRAIEITRQDDEVILRLNIITAPVQLAANERLDYTSALQATPVKPVTQDAWDYRIVRNPWYGWELDLPDKKVDGKPALQHFADKGAKVMLVWRLWDAFAYPLPIGQEEKFRRLVRECHRYGLKVVPYVGGFLLSEDAPEAPFFGDEMRVYPSGPFTLRMPGLKPQMGIYACQRGPWQDFLVHGIGRLIDEYDVDGVYLDSTTIPWQCRNELHGCGYVKPDGERAGVYPVFSVRDNLRRIYTAVKQRKPDGIVDVHVYDCMNVPGLAWATTYWNGEQLARRDYKLDALSLDRFRTEFMGVNWGVPADLLYYKLGGYRQSCAMALLHDIPVRAENLKDLDVQAALWTIRDRFGVKQARWMPYWNNGDVVQIEPERCYASLFVHPQGRVLAYVSNLSKEKAGVQLRLDLAKLGLGADLTVTDAIAGTHNEVQDGVLNVSLPPQDFRVIWIEAAGTQR